MKYRLPFPDVSVTAYWDPVLPYPSYQFEFEFHDIDILAARSGIVVETKCTKIGPGSNGWNEFHNTNYVVVDHGDGTFARYYHVKPVVRRGKQIKAGKHLGALYGEALSTAPHMHFNVHRVENGRDIFIPIEFII